MRSDTGMKMRLSLAAALAVACAAAAAADSREYHRFDGELTEDRLGVATGSLGDVNGDGFDDVLVGARYADVNGLTDVGSVYVYSGKDGTTLYRVTGEGAGDWFGVSVAGIGDVDGDARPDFAVGAQFAKRGDGTSTGAAYVYSGATGARLLRLFGDGADGRFGVSVGGGRDVNGDGVPDLIVGAYLENSAYLYSGAGGARIAKLIGTPGTWYGFAVAMLPDVDSDKSAELVVTAPQSGAGTAAVYSGATRNLRYTLTGEKAGDWYGFAVANAGNLDGKGKSELLVGAREASPNGLSLAGSVYVYESKDGSLLKRLDGARANDAFGTSVAGVGDVNRDSVRDILIGARFGADALNQATGSAYVYSGSDFSQITKTTGEFSSDWFGGSVAAVGDSNGDGWLEWVVGAAGADPNGQSNAGRAYLQGILHNDVKMLSVTAPSPAAVGQKIKVKYNIVNHGEDAGVTIALQVNGVQRASSTVSLASMVKVSGKFNYTLSDGDFSGGLSTVCVQAEIDGLSDDYPSDNSQCIQIAQAS